MVAEVSGLVGALRTGVDIADATTAYQELYEHWLSREQWQLATELVPLLVGVDPKQWSHHIETHGLVTQSRRLTSILSAELKCGENEDICLMQCRQIVIEHQVTLPNACERVLEFIQHVLPTSLPDVAAEQALAGDRECVLGAALALVTRFPEQCRDQSGFFDGRKIAKMILEQGAIWFPLEPSSLAEAEIATLLEQYLS